MERYIQEVNPEKANYCIIFVRNGINHKEVLYKSYFYIAKPRFCSTAILETIYKHPELIMPGIRMDIYKVMNGKVCLND